MHSTPGSIWAFKSVRKPLRRGLKALSPFGFTVPLPTGILWGTRTPNASALGGSTEATVGVITIPPVMVIHQPATQTEAATAARAYTERDP